MGRADARSRVSNGGLVLVLPAAPVAKSFYCAKLVGGRIAVERAG